MLNYILYIYNVNIYEFKENLIDNFNLFREQHLLFLRIFYYYTYTYVSHEKLHVKIKIMTHFLFNYLYWFITS